ncbi:MAG: type II toxin-antitoxin system VapC family toxin [Oscillochloris sp.]|nr:type II toxin-antitoxin system VapC family toxin [Oscillochloris sp.]
MKYLLDTNVISELISKQPNRAVLDWLDQLDPQAVYLSAITLGEIRKGIEKLPLSERRATVMQWLETDLLIRFAGKIADLNTAVMLTWGEMVGQLELAARPMPAIDSLIAAIVRQGNFVLVTRNDADFQHTGITVMNPWKQA